MGFDSYMTADELAVELGERLARLRLDFMLTQADLARKAGVSKRSIERLEGAVGNPQMKVFLAVCAALGLSSKFELLLPERTLSPEEIFRRHKLSKRVRKHKRTENWKWGDEQ